MMNWKKLASLPASFVVQPAFRCKDDPNIDVYTIAGFACKVCGSEKPDYYEMATRLMDEPELFPYAHVVVDEGHIFGISDIEGACVLEMLRDAVYSIQELRIVGDMDEDGCRRLLEHMGVEPTRRPARKLANEFGVKLMRQKF